MLRLHAPMMRTEYPRFQIRDNDVNQWKMVFSVLRVTVHGKRLVLVSESHQFVIALPPIAEDFHFGSDVLFHELGEHVHATVGDHL
jgi:hypothetical protein